MQAINPAMLYVVWTPARVRRQQDKHACGDIGGSLSEVQTRPLIGLVWGAEAETKDWSWGSLQLCLLSVTLLRRWWADQKNHSGGEAKQINISVRLKMKTAFSNKANKTKKDCQTLLTPTPFYWQWSKWNAFSEDEPFLRSGPHWKKQQQHPVFC